MRVVPPRPPDRCETARLGRARVAPTPDQAGAASTPPPSRCAARSFRFPSARSSTSTVEADARPDQRGRRTELRAAIAPEPRRPRPGSAVAGERSESAARVHGSESPASVGESGAVRRPWASARGARPGPRAVRRGSPTHRGSRSGGAGVSVAVPASRRKRQSAGAAGCQDCSRVSRGRCCPQCRVWDAARGISRMRS
jgi:hypothetical protein